jgi:predicted nucleic acid-binding protein
VSLVVDASVIFAFLIQEPPEIDLEGLDRAGVDLHVPAICDTEVVAAVSRHVRRGAVSADEGRDLLLDYVSLPITRHLHPGHVGRTFDLRDNVSARDAAYVVLAEALGVGLVTVDRALTRAVRRHTRVPILP